MPCLAPLSGTMFRGSQLRFSPRHMCIGPQRIDVIPVTKPAKVADIRRSPAGERSAICASFAEMVRLLYNSIPVHVCPTR